VWWAVTGGGRCGGAVCGKAEGKPSGRLSSQVGGQAWDQRTWEVGGWGLRGYCDGRLHSGRGGWDRVETPAFPTGSWRLVERSRLEAGGRAGQRLQPGLWECSELAGLPDPIPK
jgi:hypothetical protein